MSDTPGFADARTALSLTSLPIGHYLVAAGLISNTDLDDGLARQKHSGLRLGEELIGHGKIRPVDFYRALATQTGLPFVNLISDIPDESLLTVAQLDLYLEARALPWRRVKGTLVFASTDPRAARAVLETCLSEPFLVYQTSSFDILWTTQKFFAEELSAHARDRLHTMNPTASAKVLLSNTARLVCIALLCCLVLAIIVLPTAMLLLANFVAALAFLSLAALRLTALRGARRTVTPPPVTTLTTAPGTALPRYSVLVPMLREAEVLPILVNALKRLDYPPAKLDIKLVLEADDKETIDAARSLTLPGNFEIIRVPGSEPMTKPKACNYALHFVRGDYVVVFDAEDMPHPQQLREAARAFEQGDAMLACVQAPLTYYNWGENWLTKHFAIEYAAIFDLLLPMLSRLNLPFPLGGTSTHFRTDALRAVGAWDAYNVTEDADLGFRLYEAGYRTATIIAPTLEEANCHLPNWVRQRSRWLKGWMQTYLVRMRHPILTWRQLGPRGFVIFQIVIGAFLLSALLHPLFYPMMIYALVLGLQQATSFQSGLLALFNLTVLVLGFSAAILSGLVGAMLRRLDGLSLHALSMPAYWLLISFASYKALFQLITRPHYWEKTVHGLSVFTPSLTAQARTARVATDRHKT
ncbi:MAG: glycosyltransferase [Alphaproteobacteria bacterium]|nr:glycosyltransferase [Alphaproteobacteria bacterium]MBO6628742.1 glycosyltransferase [Alphaproteobacteria bacterium]MDF1627376.1 glycosyltransferase [Parvibaculaceae bacterium]